MAGPGAVARPLAGAGAVATLVGPFMGDAVSFTAVPLASRTWAVGVVGVPPRPRPRPLPSPDGDPGDPGVVAAVREAVSASWSFLGENEE